LVTETAIFISHLLNNITMLKINLSGHFNQNLSDKGFSFPGTIQINPEKSFKDNLESITKFLQGLGIVSDSNVIIALPGMSILATMVTVALHGLTGQFPEIAPLFRNENGEFVCVETIDLQTMRNHVCRNMREKIISL
jgi:hypothetical protein